MILVMDNGAHAFYYMHPLRIKIQQCLSLSAGILCQVRELLSS